MTLPLSLARHGSAPYQSAYTWTPSTREETRIGWLRPLERAFARHPVFAFVGASLLTGLGMVAAVTGLVLVLVCPAALLAGIL